MAGDEWYVAQGTGSMGLFSTEDLRRMAGSGELKPDDMLWKTGMQQWVPARSAKNLFPAQIRPPPLPSEQAVPPPLPPSIPPPLPSPSRAPRPEQPASDGNGVELAEKIPDNEVELAEEVPATGADPRPSRTGATRPRPKGFWAGFSDPKHPWSTGWMVALVILTIILAPFSIGFGIYGLIKPPKKRQGGILLAVAIVSFIVALGLSGNGAVPGVDDRELEPDRLRTRTRDAGSRQGYNRDRAAVPGTGGRGGRGTTRSACSSCDGSGFLPSACVGCNGTGVDFIGAYCRLCSRTGKQPCMECAARRGGYK